MADAEQKQPTKQEIQKAVSTMLIQLVEFMERGETIQFQLEVPKAIVSPQNPNAKDVKFLYLHRPAVVNVYNLKG